jgi:large subunit ribosomal protein L22
MDVKVSLNNLRIAPRKTREVADLIRGKSVTDAKKVLEFTIKRAASNFLKLLESGIDSALNNFKANESSLYIKKITVDEGPKLKRFFPMSRGRGYPIMKRTSHITIVLSERSQEPNVRAEKVSKLKTKKRI